MTYRKVSVGARFVLVFALLVTLLGAMPVPMAHADTLTVNTASDHDDGLCDPPDCTLREAIKYANPDDHSQTWTGRGRRPFWLLARLKKGASLEDFAI